MKRFTKQRAKRRRFNALNDFPTGVGRETKRAGDAREVRPGERVREGQGDRAVGPAEEGQMTSLVDIVLGVCLVSPAA